MAVYSLVAEPGTQHGEAIRVDIVLVELAERKKLHPEEISVNGQDDKDVKLSARRGGWIAYEALKSGRIISRQSDLPHSGVVFDFAGGTSSQINGPSAGLCFLIKMAQHIIEEFLCSQGREVPVYDFAATGILASMRPNEQVAGVEAITAKIQAAVAAVRPGGCVFYPRANTPLDATAHQEAHHKQIDLVAIDTPYQALDILLKQYGIVPQAETFWCRRCILILLGGVSGLAILAGIALKLLSPVGNTRLTHPPSPPVINAQVVYRGKEGRSGPLPAGIALAEGDFFRVHFGIDRPCYPYVFVIDTADRMTWLFPATPHSRPLGAGAYLAPEDEDGEEVWLQLDNVPGEETIFILAATSPSEWLENLRGDIDQSKRLSPVRRRELREGLREYIKREQNDQRGTVIQQTVPHQ